MALLKDLYIRKEWGKMKVIKRDGRTIEFDREKIEVAIEKANKEVRGKEKDKKKSWGNFRVRKFPPHPFQRTLKGGGLYLHALPFCLRGSCTGELHGTYKL